MGFAGDFLNLQADYLEANDIDNVFTKVQPDSPANCVTLGGLPGNTLQAQRDVPGLQFPRFQAIIRNENDEDGSAVFQAVRELLHGQVGLILPVGVDVDTEPYIRVMRCHADQEGGPIGEDLKGRLEWSINFSAEFHYVDPT